MLQVNERPVNFQQLIPLTDITKTVEPDADIFIVNGATMKASALMVALTSLRR